LGWRGPPPARRQSGRAPPATECARWQRRKGSAVGPLRPSPGRAISG
jgi:hypothetical protein